MGEALAWRRKVLHDSRMSGSMNVYVAITCENEVDDEMSMEIGGSSAPPTGLLPLRDQQSGILE